MISTPAPTVAALSPAELRAQLVLAHDPATVDAVLASVAAYLRASTEAGRKRVSAHGPDYARGWMFRGERAAEQLLAASTAPVPVRIPHQRTAA